MKRFLFFLTIIVLISSCARNQFSRQKYTDLSKIEVKEEQTINHPQDQDVYSEKVLYSDNGGFNDESKGLINKGDDDLSSAQTEQIVTKNEWQLTRKEGVTSMRIPSDQRQFKFEDPDQSYVMIEEDAETDDSGGIFNNKNIGLLLIFLTVPVMIAGYLFYEALWQNNEKELSMSLAFLTSALLLGIGTFFFTKGRPKSKNDLAFNWKMWSVIKFILAVINLVIAGILFFTEPWLTVVFAIIAIFHILGAFGMVGLSKNANS